MSLLKTMFYPVYVASKTIYIDPRPRKREIAGKWEPMGKVCVAVRGEELLTDEFYKEFKRVPTVTMETILAEWKEEVARSKHLWESAAKTIVDILSRCSPETALENMKSRQRTSRHMAINASYMRAVNDLKAVIAQQAQAS